MKFFIGKKNLEYYGDLLIKADLGLHGQIADALRAELPSRASVLDFGAGEGALSARLADLGFQVVAADKDQDSFKCKNAQFSRVDFDRPDQLLRFVEEHEMQFDAVIGVEVIEHVQDRWQYVRQLMRMAKPGGLVMITTPNTTSWLSRILFLRTGRFHQFADADLSYGHISPTTPWELSLILRESGAQDVKLRSAGTLPPIYFTSLKSALLNLLVLPLRPFMSGFVDGWAIIATGRKPV